MRTTRTRMTLEDALAFNPRWTDADRAKVARAFELLPADPYVYSPASGRYVDAFTADREFVFQIGRGYIDYAAVLAPDGAGREFRGPESHRVRRVDLSTRQTRR